MACHNNFYNRWIVFSLYSFYPWHFLSLCHQRICNGYIKSTFPLDILSSQYLCNYKQYCKLWILFLRLTMSHLLSPLVHSKNINGKLCPWDCSFSSLTCIFTFYALITLFPYYVYQYNVIVRLTPFYILTLLFLRLMVYFLNIFVTLNSLFAISRVAWLLYFKY